MEVFFSLDIPSLKYFVVATEDGLTHFTKLDEEGYARAMRN